MRGITWSDLQVNASESLEATDVYLFPSGEQHPFQLVLAGSSTRTTVQLGAIGPAKILQDDEDASG